MSITGSLVGYENGGDVTMGSKKNRSLLNITATSTASSKQCQSLNSSLSHGSPVPANAAPYLGPSGSLRRQTHPMAASPTKHRRRRLHLNTLWSIWYGILVTLLQGYLIVQGTHRYIGLSALSWKYEKPTTELDIQIVFCGLVVLFLPLLLASALFRVGNLANDGMKLASGTKLWQGSPAAGHDGLEEEAFEGTLRSLWIHGGPTSAFIHIITAICLLLPRLLLEAKVIENGLLPRDNVWCTDLDFMVTHSDRLVVLSFMTSSPTYANSTTTTGRPALSELERKLYRNGYFEQSDLVEKFSDYDDSVGSLDTSDEAFRTHEALEMGTHLWHAGGEPPIAISTMENRNVPEPPTTLHTPLPPVRSLMTTTIAPPMAVPRLRQPTLMPSAGPEGASGSSSRESRRKDANNARNAHHRKSHASANGKGGHGAGGKGKAAGHGHHGGHHIQHQHQEQQQQRHRYAEDIDTRLELEEQRELDWSLLNQPEGTPTLIEHASSSGTGGKKSSSAKGRPSGTSHSVSSTAAAPSTATKLAGSSKRPTTTASTTTISTSAVIPTAGGKKPTAAKDSDIHILKPVHVPESIVPSTPVTTDSKIIEIKPKGGSTTTTTTTTTMAAASGGAPVPRSPSAVVSRKSKREYEPPAAVENFSSESLESIESIPSVDEDEFIIKDENGMEIKPAFLIGAAPGNLTFRPMQLTGFPALLAKLFGSPIERQFGAASAWATVPSAEFVNLAVALTVWAVRYPSVFWHTSKSFACLFSLQMIANGVDILLSFAGASVLYKLQTLGQALPLQAPALILNGTVTVALTILALILTIASSMVLYLYGHGKLAAKVRDRRMITAKQSADVWAYFAHCSSLCFVLALAVVKAPLMHDLSATYRGSLDGAVLAAALGSVIHLFLWIVLWLGLTAKRRWHFKLPPLDAGRVGGPPGTASQPLLRHGNGSLRSPNGVMVGGLQIGQASAGGGPGSGSGGEEETIYWPKIAPNSPKLKVTFNEVPSTSSELALGPHEHGNKRHPSGGTTIRLSSLTGEADDGDYATLRGPTGDLLHLGPYPDPSGSPPPPPPPPPLLDDCDLLDEASNSNTLVGSTNDHADDTSEEGKLLACVRDDSVTYASTRDLEPPISRTMSRETFMRSPEQSLCSPLAPVTVTVHNHLENVGPGSTPRCLRRADSGMPTEALTPRSDSTSTESSTSPPDCRDAPSETSSGVHSGEERDEVVIRPRSGPFKSIIKAAPPPAIQEEPFGRATNMKMSSFNKDGTSATLPLTRGSTDMHRPDYPQCSTMPLPAGYHQQQHHHYHSQASFTPPLSSSRQQLAQHTTLPNGVRQATSSNQFLKRLPYMKNAESPYGHLGLGAGHHTFSKLLHDPLGMPGHGGVPGGGGMPAHSHSNHSTFLLPATIPEDRDSANYSMISDQDREMYINAAQLGGMQMQH